MADDINSEQDMTNADWNIEKDRRRRQREKR